MEDLDQWPFSFLDEMLFELDLDEEENHATYDILIKEYFRRLEK